MLRFDIKRRLLYLAFGAAAFLIAYSVGAALPMSDEEADQLRQEFSKVIEDIDEYGIFLNNIRIALAMFIPAVGAGFGTFAGFATGSVFAAFASESPVLAGVPPLIILITPFGIMEVFTYGLAISRSGMLIVSVIKDRPWQAGKRRPFLGRMVIPTLIELGIAAAVLFAAAVIEWQLIEQFGGIDTAIITDA